MRSSSPMTMPSMSESWIACSSISISAGIAPSVPVALPSRVGDRRVVQQLDDSRELRLFADGELQRRDARAEQLLQLVERALERRTFAIELVDEERAADAALLRELPRDFGLHLDAFDGRHDEQREVGGMERSGDIADEVRVAGRVEHVDLVAVRFERRERKRHRDAAPLLLGVEVADGGAVFDPAEAVRGARTEEERLGQRGLPGAPVADQGDVADLGRREGLHPEPPG